MPFGKPREEAERFARHLERFGTEPPAERMRMGPVMETPAETLWAWMPDFPVPLPRWMSVKVFGAGRKL